MSPERQNLIHAYFILVLTTNAAFVSEGMATFLFCCNTGRRKNYFYALLSAIIFFFLLNTTKKDSEADMGEGRTHTGRKETRI